MAIKKLSTQTVDFQKLLGKMTVTDRLRTIQSEEGLAMLANLNPSQLSSLFPRYYQERLPDVGKALQSVLSSEFKGNAEKARTATTTAEQTRQEPGKFDPATGKRSYTAAKEKLAELTTEQKAVYEDMKKGFVPADDPRLKFLDKLAEQDLKKAGIERTTDETGKAGYKASAIDPEEVKRRMEMGEQGGKIKPGYEESGMSEASIRNYIRQEALKRNIDPDAAVRVATTEGMGQYQSGVINRKGERERSYGPYQLYMGGGLGNSFKKDTGIDPEQDRSARSIQMQIQYALDYAAKQGNWNAWHGVRDNGLPASMGLSRDSRAIGTSEPTVGTALTEEQAINQIHAQRRGALAGSLSELDQREKQDAEQKAKVEKQGNLSATPIERKAPSNVYTAGDSIGVGVGQANKIPSVAKGGWSFTDKRTIDQLYNVPEGSTVQLYAGTNDATNQRLDPRVYEKRMAELKQIAEERGLKVSIHGPHQSPNQSWSGNVGPVNDMMANAARNNGIRYVDNSSVQADARDNIHMSTSGYKQLYDRGLRETTVEQEGQAIPAMADGGEKTVNEGEIRALPIGAMKNDNSVVVDKDSNPLFTMNTKDESANYDPRTGKVSVDPNAKDGETKSPDVAQTLENKAAMQQSVPQISPSSDKSSFDDMLNITDNLFKDPSFHRSMARSRFGSTADPALGGQFAASGTVS